MGQSCRFTHIVNILDCLGQVNAGFIQVLYLGRAPRTKETARFSEVASGSPTSTCIPRVDG